MLIGVEHAVLDVSDSKGDRSIVMSDRDKQNITHELAQVLGREPKAAELDRAMSEYVDNEILVNEALLLGIHRVDSVVRQRILMNMAFVNGQGDDRQLLDRANQMDMYRSDIVVRRRLIERMTKIIQQQGAGVSDDALVSFIENNPERYQHPARVRVVHGYFSNRHFEKQKIDKWYQHWVSGVLTDNDMQAKATSIAVGNDRFLNARQVESLFNQAIRKPINTALLEGDHLEGDHRVKGSHRETPLPLQQGIGGYHFLKIVEITAKTSLDLVEAKKKALRDYLPIQQQRLVESTLIQLRERYHVSL